LDKKGQSSAAPFAVHSKFDFTIRIPIAAKSIPFSEGR